MRKFSFFSVPFIACIMAFSLPVSADRLQQGAIKQPGLEHALLLSVTNTGSRLVASGEHGVIIFSDDAGVSWQQASVPVSTLITDLHFFDNQIGWAVGHDGLIMRSIDSGVSWEKVLDGNNLNALRVKQLENYLSQLQKNPDVDSGLLETAEYQLDDATVASEEGPTAPLLDVLFVNADKGFVLGAYGLLLKTDDGGQHWRYVGHKLPNPDGLHLNKLHHTQKGELLMLGEAGLVMLSRDLGESWIAVDSPYDGSFFSVAESDSLYLMGLRGNVFKLELSDALVEGGALWEKVVLDTTATLNDAVVVENKAYLVGQGGALLQQSGDSFRVYGERGLRSYSAVTAMGDYLITVGESGVKRISLVGGQ